MDKVSNWLLALIAAVLIVIGWNMLGDDERAPDAATTQVTTPDDQWWGLNDYERDDACWHGQTAGVGPSGMGQWMADKYGGDAGKYTAAIRAHCDLEQGAQK